MSKEVIWMQKVQKALNNFSRPMDPDGYFRGNTVHASWQEVKDARAYSVSIDQCNEDTVCNQVIFNTSLYRL